WPAHRPGATTIPRLQGNRARGCTSHRPAGRRPWFETSGRSPAPCAGSRSLDLLYEVGGDVEGLVEHREQAVALALEDLQSRVGNELDLFFQQVDAREGIAIAAHEEGRALDAREVFGAELVGESRTVERIGEEDEAAEVRLDGGHARDATTERLASADHVVTAARGLDEYGHGSLSATARH